LFWRAADGTGAAERLAESKNAQTPSSVSPDGRALFFEEPGASTDMYVLPLDGERKGRALIATMFAERNAELSPDGKWIAYQSTESGRDEVYVRPFPDIDKGRWQVSAGGGRQPL
jgi:Tol biopolymer transport system component